MSCAACFTGTVRHDEKPQGKEIALHGRKTYVAEPEGEPQGIIIIIPDAFGIDFLNNKILADHYARKGNFKVYLPDFMDGYCAPTSIMDSLPRVISANSAISDWLWKPYYLAKLVMAFVPFVYANRFGLSMPKVLAFFESVRSQEGASLPIGAAGFCWGGQHTFKLAESLEASNGKPLIDAAFTGHPSNLTIPTDIEKIRKPTSIAIGDNDFVLSIPNIHRIEAIFKAIPDVETDVVIYQGAGHGFAVRGDYNNERQSQQAQDAEDQAINWYKRAFSKVSY